MEGPDILAQTLTKPRKGWQYHSRGTRHSITACWGVLLDLLTASPLLQDHVIRKKVVFGLDHEMRDYPNNRKKKLDLVIARPEDGHRQTRPTFRDLPGRHSMQLTQQQKQHLASLPNPQKGRVGAVLLALEAKAMFTAFGKSLPRFYDELNSSHLVIHGASNNALAVGLAIINTADQFISPVSNPNKQYSQHNQPKDALSAITKVGQLPRRVATGSPGYEGLGIILVNCANDGRPVTVATRPAVPGNYRYRSMVTRIATEYDVRFQHI